MWSRKNCPNTLCLVLGYRGWSGSVLVFFGLGPSQFAVRLQGQGHPCLLFGSRMNKDVGQGPSESVRLPSGGTHVPSTDTPPLLSFFGRFALHRGRWPRRGRGEAAAASWSLATRTRAMVTSSSGRGRGRAELEGGRGRLPAPGHRAAEGDRPGELQCGDLQPLPIPPPRCVHRAGARRLLGHHAGAPLQDLYRAGAASCRSSAMLGPRRTGAP